MLWRAGYTPDLYAFYEANKRESLQDPECHITKAVDEHGQLMAASEWAFVLDPQKHAEGKKPVDPDGLPPSNWPVLGNWELRRFFNLNLEKWEREYLAGRPYIKLEILVTHPDLQGRGAGSKLLAWGVEQADKHGVVMALESTPAGLSLYKRFGFKRFGFKRFGFKRFGFKRFGFKEADVIKADMRQFGWDQPYDEEAAKRVWMIREPLTSVYLGLAAREESSGQGAFASARHPR